MLSHNKVMLFSSIFLKICSISVGWDHLYGTGLDVGLKIDFKSTAGDIWNLLTSPGYEVAGFPRHMEDGKIRILKSNKQAQN